MNELNLKIVNDSVCAIVVTYNRTNMLLECLDSLRKQTQPVDALYIIDNASTDGTQQSLFDAEYITELPPSNMIKPWGQSSNIHNLVDKKEVTVHYVRMHENTGGAGGFHEGVKRAYEKGYSWLWLMDDDVEPFATALETLLEHKTLANLGYLCSCVRSKDGKRSMNAHVIDDDPGPNGYPDWDEYLDRGIVKVERCSFVSLLLSKNTISVCGYPYKSFFIWGDDTEYTLRVTKKFHLSGYLVGDSKVVHKRSTASLMDILSEKEEIRVKFFFYSYRNNMYIFRKYFSKAHVLKAFFDTSRTLILLLISRDKLKWKKIKVIVAGTVQGIVFKPR